MGRFLIILFLIFSSTTFAQEKIGQIKMKLASGFASQLRIKADSEGYLALVYKKTYDLHIEVYSPNFELVSGLKVPYSSILDQTYSGIRSTPDHIAFYFATQDREKSAMDAYILSKKKGGKSGKITGIEFTESKNFVLVSKFSHNDEMYVLLLDRATNQFNLIKMGDMRNYETIRFDSDKNLQKVVFNGGDRNIPAELLTLELALNGLGVPYYFDAYYRYIDPDFIQSLPKTFSMRKLYVEDNKIHLIRDNESADTVETTIITLDVDKGIAKARSVYFPHLRYANHNSILFKDRFITTSFSGKNFTLRILDFNDLSIVANFDYTNYDSLNFMWSKFHKHNYVPPTETAIREYGYKVKEFKETSTILRNLKKGLPALSVDTYNDNLAISIGGLVLSSINDDINPVEHYYPFISEQVSPLVPYMIDFTTQARINLVEGVLMDDYFNYFHVVLDSNTYKPLQNNGDMFFYEKVLAYLKSHQRTNFRNFHDINLIHYRGSKCLFFYSRRNKALEIIAFPD